MAYTWIYSYFFTIWQKKCPYEWCFNISQRCWYSCTRRYKLNSNNKWSNNFYRISWRWRLYNNTLNTRQSKNFILPCISILYCFRRWYNYTRSTYWKCWSKICWWCRWKQIHWFNWTSYKWCNNWMPFAYWIQA